MENSTKAPRGKPFAKGNPGRPRGARNKTAVALEALLEGQAEAIVAKVVEKALEGDRVAMRLVFERILGPRAGRSVSLNLEPIASASDAAVALAKIVASVADGELTPGEGAEVAQLVGSTVRAFEARDFEKRLEEVEGRLRDAPVPKN